MTPRETSIVVDPNKIVYSAMNEKEDWWKVLRSYFFVC